jgi:hypothetical protein
MRIGIEGRVLRIEYAAMGKVASGFALIARGFVLYGVSGAVFEYQ